VVIEASCSSGGEGWRKIICLKWWKGKKRSSISAGGRWTEEEEEEAHLL